MTTTDVILVLARPVP